MQVEKTTQAVAALLAALFVFNTNETYSLFQLLDFYFRKPKLLSSLGLLGS